MVLVASGVLKEVKGSSAISSRNLKAASDAATVDGKLYAYPLTADNGYFLFYNKAYLSDQDVQAMDRIKTRMDDNKRIAGELDNETAIFTKI